MKILFKYPIRASFNGEIIQSRIDKFFDTLDKYYEYIENKTDYFFLISCDTEDIGMNNLTIRKRFENYKNLYVRFDDNKSKIEACNAGVTDFVENEGCDIIMLISDDMIPQVVGFDNIIRDDMYRLFPDTDGCLWYSDGFQRDRLCTLSIIGVKYYNRFNYIYHSSYFSVWSDYEFQVVAQSMGKIQYNPKCLIRHEHKDFTMLCGKQGTLYANFEPVDFGMGDSLNKRDDSNGKLDSTNFQNRQKLGFPIN